MTFYPQKYQFYLLFISCCILNLSLSFAQTFDLNDSLKSYYSLTNQAEMAIIDSNYIAASKFYEDAFKFKKLPFSNDYYNKALCDAINKDYKSTTVSLKHILALGYNMDSLIQTQTLFAYFRSNQGKALILLNSNLKKEEPRPLHNFYDSLLFLDQEYRNLGDPHKPYPLTKELRERDSILSYSLLEKINLYGFPTEHSVGLFDNHHLNLGLFIVIAHNSPLLDRINTHLNLNPKFKDILTNALITGKADIRVYNELYQAVMGRHVFATSYERIVQMAISDTTETKGYSTETKTPLSLKKLPESYELDEFNKVRVNAGLSTIEESRIKLIRSIKNSRKNILSDFGFISFIQFEDIPVTTYSKDMYLANVGNLISIF